MASMQRDVRYVALDTETTGFEPSEGHRIVELGLAEFMNGIRTGRTFHTLIDPERDVPAEAVEVHQLTADILDGQPKFAEKAGELLAFCEGAVIVIHNRPFDLKFLDAELARMGEAPFSGRFETRDSLLEARQRWPWPRKNDLDALCERLRVDNSRRTAAGGRHGALIDAELLAEVYMKMCGADGLAHAFAPAPARTQTAAAVPAAVPAAAVREFIGGGEPTPEELERHAALVGKLKNPLWISLAAA